MRALLALVALDEGIAKLEASVAEELRRALEGKQRRAARLMRLFNPDWNERL